MKITPARVHAKLTVRRYGYYRMADDHFKVKCDLCGDMVHCRDWVGNLRTENMIHNSLVSVLASHLMEDH